MKEISSKDFKSEVEESKSLVVIDLYADWCGPCKMLSPTLDALENEFPEVKFVKINVDKEPSLAMQFKVQSIPFIAFVKDNTFLDMSVGLVPKEKLVKFINDNK
jgi:thioredoxin 1